MTNCLVMPSTYVEVKDEEVEEVEYEDGGKFLSTLLGAIGGLCGIEAGVLGIVAANTDGKTSRGCGTAARILGIIAGACTIACVFLKW